MPLGSKLWAYAAKFFAPWHVVSYPRIRAVTVIITNEFVAVPQVFKAWPLQILLAGAVGYGTNFLAIQMLFKPRKCHLNPYPLRWIWKQGLIPAKQVEDG